MTTETTFDIAVPSAFELISGSVVSVTDGMDTEGDKTSAENGLYMKLVFGSQNNQRVHYLSVKKLTDSYISYESECTVDSCYKSLGDGLRRYRMKLEDKNLKPIPDFDLVSVLTEERSEA